MGLIMRKTATIVRSHVYGTPRYELSVTYRGETLAWVDSAKYSFAITLYATIQEDRTASDVHRQRTCRDIQWCEGIARKWGFTHIRFAGEWSPNRLKPNGGAL